MTGLRSEWNAEVNVLPPRLKDGEPGTDREYASMYKGKIVYTYTRGYSSQRPQMRTSTPCTTYVHTYYGEGKGTRVQPP